MKNKTEKVRLADFEFRDYKFKSKASKQARKRIRRAIKRSTKRMPV